MTVTLCVWRVTPAAVPLALWGMAVDRGRLRRTAGVRFAKLLGTAKLPGSADLTRWAALVVSDGPAPPIPTRNADSTCTITMVPIASRGRWAGETPFKQEPQTPFKQEPQTPFKQEHGTDGNPVLALTRARLTPHRAPAFWRASRTVADILHHQPGLLAAFGIGEAPIGFQGTVSIWRTGADMVRFAYRQPEHTAVVADTPRKRWYAEELFARFHVLDVAGDRELIGWKVRP